jgi:D-serine deaminase-like pyridoxal phosphate-dependent protein
MTDSTQSTARHADHARMAALELSDYSVPDAIATQIMTPALVLFERHIRDNIQQMLRYMNGNPQRWRAHLKTTKTPEIYAELITAGLRSFKCATPREALCMLEVSAHAGVHDVDILLAFPFQGPALTRVAQIAAQFSQARVSVLSESPEHVSDIPDCLGVFVDINPGMNRTGIELAQRDRIHAVAAAAGKRFAGLHFYDGHIHAPTAEARRAATHALYNELLELRTDLHRRGIHTQELITSGTPAFRSALEFPGFANGQVVTSTDETCIHRVSPGTVVLHDLRSDELLEDVDLKPAALLLARVVSQPSANLVTCDAGSKSLAAEAGAPVAFVVGHPGLTAQTPSEEHLPLKLDGSTKMPAYGQLLLLVPSHVCPTVNLAEQALWVGADGSTKVVSITARAHELMLDASH